MSGFDGLYASAAGALMSVLGDEESAEYFDHTRRLGPFDAIYVHESQGEEESIDGRVKVNRARITFPASELSDPWRTGTFVIAGKQWSVASVDDSSPNLVTVRLVRTEVLEKTRPGFRQ